MIKALIDTNIILDFLQDRQPFVEDALRVFEKVDTGEVEGFIAATTITNIYYIVRRAAGLQAAKDAIAQILTDLPICTVNRSVLEPAISGNFKDFEDAVQYACGMAYGVDVIVTRDASGFVDAEIPVMSPGELNRILDSKSI
ncbi:PIN domain-containing protein [Scytonema sp. NUACC21]